jgi:hypothetical protein
VGKELNLTTDSKTSEADPGGSASSADMIASFIDLILYQKPPRALRIKA